MVTDQHVSTGRKAGIPGMVAVGLLVVGLGAAAVWSVRVGVADYWARQETVAGMEKAVAITPGEASYHVLLGLRVGEDDSGRASKEFRKSVALNPADAHSWIELGLRTEASGGFPAAEQYMLRAAEADRTYLPRWTLMNYYFRRNQT